MKKIAAAALITLLIINMILLALGQIPVWLFWVIILAGFLGMKLIKRNA